MGRCKTGEFVKVEVRDEWLWVLVDSSDHERRLVFVKLDNEPIVHTYMRLGMEAAVSYGNIRHHRTASSFKQ
jgi:hypothetical protein